MIPTLIVVGLVFGRHPLVVTLAAMVMWPALLVMYGIVLDPTGLVGAAALAAPNVLVGAAVNRLFALVARHAIA